MYQNIKQLRFDFHQEFQCIKLANGAAMFSEFIRMPELTNRLTCIKNLRVVGAQDITVFDSRQGTTGNPIYFACEVTQQQIIFYQTLNILGYQFHQFFEAWLH